MPGRKDSVPGRTPDYDRPCTRNPQYPGRAGLTRLHGFGIKIGGLIRCRHLLTSADSMAWSFAARHQPPLPGCQNRHRNCANCPRYAARWYTRIRAALTTTRTAYTQPPLFDLDGGDG